MPNDPIEEWLREVVIGEIERQAIVVADYDPVWPERVRALAFLASWAEEARALAEKPHFIRSLHGPDRPSEQPESMVFYGHGKRISYFRLHEASRLLSRALLRQAKNALPGAFH